VRRRESVVLMRQQCSALARGSQWVIGGWRVMMNIEPWNQPGIFNSSLRVTFPLNESIQISASDRALRGLCFDS
jgi:hypothetical protein